MDPYMSVFFMITVSFPEAMVISYFVITFMGGKPRLPEIILIALIQAVVAFIVRSLPIPMGMHTIFLILSYIVLICLIARISMWASSVGVVIVVIVFILAEVSVTQLVTAVTGLTMSGLVNDQYNRLLFTFPTIGMLFAIAFLLKRFNVTFARITGWQVIKEKYQVVPDPGSSVLYKEYLPAVVFIFLPLLLLWLLNFTHVSVQVNDSGGKLFKVLFNTLIIMLAFMSLWAVQRIRRSIEKEMEAARAAETIKQFVEREARLETELRHVKEMQNLNLKMRVERHDFYNHLTAIYGYLKANQYKQAESYIKTLYESVRQIEDLLGVNPPELGALLSVKQEEARARGIEFSWQVNIESGALPLSPEDMTQLTGNLLDNALEAAASGSSPRVDLVLAGNKLGLQLKVSNTGAPISQDIQNNMFAAGYTTKNLSRHSGLGLFIIKQIVDRHGGRLDLMKPEIYPGVEFVIYIPWNS